MSRNDKIDPTDERSGTIVKETDCACEDGACCWHDNTPAQSERRSGDRYPSAPGGDD